jgi:predicted dehydrogenase
MSKTIYRSVLIGLTGIGAARPAKVPNIPLFGEAPRSHAAAYAEHPQTDLVAVCDIRQEKLTEFQHLWGDVWPDMRYYTDYREMLAQEKPQIVSIATPDHLHAQITVDVAQSGARAILCEKPIATTLADAEHMIAACEANHVLLSIEHTRRWSPHFHAVRELIRSGELGALRVVTSNMYSRRSMLFRNGTHSIDLLCFFAESEPEWLFAHLEEGFDDYTEYRGDGRDPAKDPAASAYIHFKNGVRAFYNSVKVDMPGSQFELVCDNGRIEISDRGVILIRGDSYLEWARSELVPPAYMYTHHIGAIAELINVMENGGQLVSPGEEALKTVKIMLGMLHSHHHGNVRVNL